MLIFKNTAEIQCEISEKVDFCDLYTNWTALSVIFLFILLSKSIDI